jgi:hypothetical protein
MMRWFILLIVVASAIAYVGSILWRKHIYRQPMVSAVLIAERLGAISDERLETERLLPSEPVFFCFQWPEQT